MADDDDNDVGDTVIVLDEEGDDETVVDMDIDGVRETDIDVVGLAVIVIEGENVGEDVRVGVAEILGE